MTAPGTIHPVADPPGPRVGVGEVQASEFGTAFGTVGGPVTVNQYGARRAGGLGGQVVSAQVHSSARVVGREEELAALHGAFSTAGASRRPVLRVLTGLGGVGKTSLARTYAQRHLDDYGVVWWVRAEDPTAVLDEFRTLLEILAPQDAAAVADPVAAVHSLLAGRSDRWLLVLDNVPDPPALRGLVPAVGAGDVLVTSRAGIWPDRRMVLPVTPLAESAAVQLVTSVSDDSDRATAAILAQELGGLPLALAQAASYVAQNALDLTDYLALYRRRRAALHREGYVPDYPATVATTWQLAFDRLPGPSRALLCLLTWYAADAIPLDLLLASDTDRIELPGQVGERLRALLVDEIHRHRATAELITYGLLTRSGPERSVTMHRLVQAVSADDLTAHHSSDAWIGAAAAVVAAACPQSLTTMGDTTAWQRLQTHVRTVINHLSPDQPITFKLRVLLAYWTGTVGDVVRAREPFSTVVEDAGRVLGRDHIESLVARTKLAYWTGQAGDVVRARDLSAVLVEDMMRVLGPDDRHTLLARHYVAYWTGQAGDVVRARDLSVRVLEDEKRVLGAEDPDTLELRCDLARWTGEAGDAARARELLAAVVGDVERVLGPNDRLTLMARFHLARWTGEAGNAARARELFTTLVDDDERVLGPDDPWTLDARFLLSRWTQETGDAAHARELLAAVEKDVERVLGPGYRDTLRGRHWRRTTEISDDDNVS